MNYYDKNAQEFFDSTINADMSSHHEKFISYMPEKGNILDAGCGSGRDTLFFKNHGYDVTSIDGSMEMCKLASEYAKTDVLHMQFQEMEFQSVFDGIWASASLLHIPTDEIESILAKFKDALKNNGIFYASFKYGDFEGIRNGRFFNDLTKETAIELFEKADFEVIETWITTDSRIERQHQKWTNIIVRK